jgi:hypothetical protein
MQRIRELWIAFRNIAIVFSFIMNFILVITLLVVLNILFQITTGIAEPLVDGLYTDFAGLNESQIETNVVVDDTIPIDFDLTLDETTTVTLAEAAVINNVPAQFEITGGGGSISGTVDITLPQGTPLTIDLSLLVPVEQTIPVVLNVPVDIALQDTQLSIPFTNLGNLLEPYVKLLDNLPQTWGDVPSFTVDVLDGNVDLLRETDDSRNPLPADYFGEPDDTTETVVDGASPVDSDTLPAENTATDDLSEPAIDPTPTITPLPAQGDSTTTPTPPGIPTIGPSPTNTPIPTATITPFVTN